MSAIAPDGVSFENWIGRSPLSASPSTPAIPTAPTTLGKVVIPARIRRRDSDSQFYRCAEAIALGSEANGTARPAPPNALISHDVEKRPTTAKSSPDRIRTFGRCLGEQNGIATPRYSLTGLTEALESEETTGVWFERERVYGCPRRTSVARTAPRPGGRAAPGLESVSPQAAPAPATSAFAREIGGGSGLVNENEFRRIEIKLPREPFPASTCTSARCCSSACAVFLKVIS